MPRAAVVRAIMCGGLLLPALSTAEQTSQGPPGPPPLIQRVTLQLETGIIAVTGTGLGPGLEAVIDGQRAPLLPGATATEIQLLAPASVLGAAGAYRLAIVDPARQASDHFVVLNAAGLVTGAAIPSAADTGPGDGTPRRSDAMARGTAGLAAPSVTTGGISPTLLEGPTNTSVGQSALINNTSGTFNTAAGAQALYSNTSGFGNTATGAGTLASNTIGTDNTGTGSAALQGNTAGVSNTASGAWALRWNTTGSWNVASGFNALYENTTGIYNTATGSESLHENTSGFWNVATGAKALFSNTTGSYNVGEGVGALYSNTTGAGNVAAGVNALWTNSTGNYNVALGTNALYNTTTGALSVGVGHNAGVAATDGAYNIYLGANVAGQAGEAKTIRLGLPYDATLDIGQTRAFIAGIHGTQLTGPAVQVFVDANGQLGTLTPPIVTGTGTISPTLSMLQRQVEEQQATIAELRATVAQMRARLVRVERR